MQYTPADIEDKWRKHWQDTGVYRVTDDPSKPKYYVLDMFPYPSGAGLHVGHPLGYIASDIYARSKRMKGYNVLHPMGFDAFGLPAEEYAIQTGIHPADSTRDNMERYREQLGQLGFMYDWSREVSTCDPDYYKWTQWIFTQLYEHAYDLSSHSAISIAKVREAWATSGSVALQLHTDDTLEFSAQEWKDFSPEEQAERLSMVRLAYRKVGYVNWCDELGTVLANDQVKDGLSERGGHPVIQKPMTQWYLRITAYADRLLAGLETLDWSDSLKAMQRNWIGKSVGASIHFGLSGREETLEIFTTRPDTLYGATFMVLAPEHELVEELTSEDQREAVDAYIQQIMAKSEIERMANKEVTGCPLGATAIHPLSGEPVPIYIAEYVLKDYGTGAIMAVPSRDDRDHAFAQKFDLPIIEIIDQSDYPDAEREDKVGKMIHSDFLDGMSVKDAIAASIKKLEELGTGRKQVNYRMRDANFSRQRYWGEPFPVLYDDQGDTHMVELSDLPVKLPRTEDFKPASDKSPLARLDDWVHEVPGHTRETDVMPAVAGSSWYYLRYMDPQNDQAPVGQDAVQYWQDVDLYIGGAEHAVAHLLYARFWHKFLYDTGIVPTQEPFKKLINQGMIQGVIEAIFLDKRSDELPRRFVSSTVAEVEGISHFARIPVHVDFVSDYGSEESYLSVEGLKQFAAWRPEYGHFIVESDGHSAEIQHGKLVAATPDFRLATLSEVGKMSKSLFNVINPDDVISRYGTDCFRLYEMFLGPIEQSKPWDTKGIDGVYKFLRKFWTLFIDKDGTWKISDQTSRPTALKLAHECIKKVNEDIERFSFNTCVSAFMICTNGLREEDRIGIDVASPLIRLIAPFAPHLAEELWQHMETSMDSVHKADYPQHDDQYLKEQTITYPLCINGKKKALIELDAEANHEDIETAARSHEDLERWLDGKTIKKVIVVPKRMINIVI